MKCYYCGTDLQLDPEHSEVTCPGCHPPKAHKWVSGDELIVCANCDTPRGSRRSMQECLA